MRRAAALLLGALVGCATVDTQVRPNVEPLGLEGPTKPLDFVLPRLGDGEAYKLSSDRGSVVLLEVWATWCDACRDSLPFYEELARELGGRGLKVYAISIDADARLVPAFLAGAKVALPVLHDREGRFALGELHVRAVPTTFLLDRTGSVRAVREGYDQAHLRDFVAQVEALLREPAR